MIKTKFKLKADYLREAVTKTYSIAREKKYPHFLQA